MRAPDSYPASLSTLNSVPSASCRNHLGVVMFGKLRKSNVSLSQQRKCLKCGRMSLASSQAGEVKESKNTFFLHLALPSHAERAQYAFAKLNWTSRTRAKISEETFGSILAGWLGGVFTEPRPWHLPKPQHCPPSGCQFPTSGNVAVERASSGSGPAAAVTAG